LGDLKEENARLCFDQSSKIDHISAGIERLRNDLRDAHAPQGSIIPPEGTFTLGQWERIASVLASSISTERKALAEQRILSSLRFPEQPFRYDDITAAHKDTFQWIYNPESPFSCWLAREEGIFWVSGKAGSGKSTLMKFITRNPATDDLLSEWAPQGFVSAAYYFWSSGTDMQKSQKGLMQTIVYDVFRRCPELISDACVRRWNDCLRVPTWDSTWSMAELSEALRYIATAEKVQHKFCFFVDGLDEYQGDHLDLCELITAFSRSKKIKLCVSSRPWNVFEDAFGMGPKFYLQDLTRNDLELFIYSRLSSHPRWQSWGLDSQTKSHLIADISNRAEGVFLWAFLVTKSLREGLTNGDTIKDLLKRLEAIPASLERLFRYILDAIDLQYHERMARIILIALFARYPLHCLVYKTTEEEQDDEDYAIHLPIKPIEYVELELPQKQAKRHINAWTSGLLEVQHYQEVQFLHRSVRDFFSTGEMRNYFTSKINYKFDTGLSLLRATLAIIKSFHAEQAYELLLHQIEAATGFAERAEQANSTKVSNLLDKLDDTIRVLRERGSLNGSRIGDVSSSPVRRTILQSRLAWYVGQKLEEDPHYFKPLGRPPLDVLISHNFDITRSAEMLDLFLRKGQDPNDPLMVTDGVGAHLKKAYWLAILHRISWWRIVNDYGDTETRSFQEAVDNRLTSMCLASGADPNVMVGGVTAFGMYLLACFLLDMRDDETNLYLQGLDDFLKAGASLHALHMPSKLSRDFAEDIDGNPLCIDWGYDSRTPAKLYKQYCTGVISFASKPLPARVNCQRRLALLVAITKRLILKAELDAEVVEQFETTIRTAFSKPLAKPLLETLQTRAKTSYQSSAATRDQREGA
jgi:hypothetical protein